MDEIGSWRWSVLKGWCFVVKRPRSSSRPALRVAPRSTPSPSTDPPTASLPAVKRPAA